MDYPPDANSLGLYRNVPINPYALHHPSTLSPSFRNGAPYKYFPQANQYFYSQNYSYLAPQNAHSGYPTTPSTTYRDFQYDFQDRNLNLSAPYIFAAHQLSLRAIPRDRKWKRSPVVINLDSEEDAPEHCYAQKNEMQNHKFPTIHSVIEIEDSAQNKKEESLNPVIIPPEVEYPKQVSVLKLENKQQKKQETIDDSQERKVSNKLEPAKIKPIHKQKKTKGRNQPKKSKDTRKPKKSSVPKVSSANGAETVSQKIEKLEKKSKKTCKRQKSQVSQQTYKKKRRSVVKIQVPFKFQEINQKVGRVEESHRLIRQGNCFQCAIPELGLASQIGYQKWIQKKREQVLAREYVL